MQSHKKIYSLLIMLLFAYIVTGCQKEVTAYSNGLYELSYPATWTVETSPREVAFKDPQNTLSLIIQTNRSKENYIENGLKNTSTDKVVTEIEISNYKAYKIIPPVQSGIKNTFYYLQIKDLYYALNFQYPESEKVAVEPLIEDIVDSFVAKDFLSRLEASHTPVVDGEIKDKSVEELLTLYKPIISHENESWFKYVVAKELTYSDLLKGLKVTDSNESVFQVATRDNAIVKETLKAIPQTDYHNQRYNNNVVKPMLYQMNKDKNYWYQYLENEKMLYFKYNRCYEEGNNPFTLL